MAVYTKEPIDSFKSFLKQDRLSDLRSSGTEFQSLVPLKRILNFP